ncbi:ABC transporter ATP-binding protein [Pseudomonas sp. LP_7_YM]|uniref:ABC transporter ATP-binding protein n=1 Tax=Pseudomonas sp. LP_7_YM TaxID=2485137 RepID=UPI00105B8633|nr:ABC transporter ATP-binding protein [Pseudomonas sp. LP_7_YM]TDV67601.1 peptide/nickel transport system ATP-binding protein [Pseudomonas sp. LP_7_YM]
MTELSGTALTPLLRVEDLRIVARGTPERVLVDDISFTLDSGQVLGLIGESGAGKSTIGQAILGHLRQGMALTGGRILFDDKDLACLPQPQLRRIRGKRIAHVAQSAGGAFNPALTIGAQVVEAARLHGQMDAMAARERALELFRLFSLPEPEKFYLRYPHQVSGGQLQRAMIAMALCSAPDLIVFDEPTTALDVITQLGILQTIAGVIRRFGVAAIYISHDLAVVAQLADHILVLRHGRQVEYGTTRQILHAPAARYTNDLLDAGRGAHRRPATRIENPQLLSIRSLSASYHHQPVLDGISLSLLKGRTLALIGESGSGKSTLGKVVCGLLAAKSGSITLDGRALPPTLGERSREHLQRIQMIHQTPDSALNPKLLIGDQLNRALQKFTDLSREQRRRRVLELLGQVGLSAIVAQRLPHTLSGGQKQRVCVARALAAKPDLIVCDEPTSALDPLVAREILALLRQLQEDTGVSYLFITHDLHVVEEIADDVAVLCHGRIVRQGSVDEALNPPLDAYTQRLIEAVPQMREDWLAKISISLDRQQVIALGTGSDTLSWGSEIQSGWRERRPESLTTFFPES